jgi:predicted RNA-binding protein with PIN domain
MRAEIWIDGFNLFYRWELTRDGFRSAPDIGEAVDERLQILAHALDRRRRRAIVFLDGGLQTGQETRHGLRVRSPGPGRKADAMMVEYLQGRPGRAHNVTAVSSDRALAANLRGLGAEICTAEEFIDWLHAQRPRREESGRPARQLSPMEVNMWVKEFEKPKAEKDS